MIKFIYLGMGGVIGTLSRYCLTGLIDQRLGTQFPYGTLIVNVTGCFLAGLFYAVGNEKLLLSPETKILLVAGFCGAFTTFSAFILETSNLSRDGEMMKAFLNIMLSVGIGFLVFRLGSYIGASI